MLLYRSRTQQALLHTTVALERNVGVDDIWLIVAPMLRFRSICGRCAICTIANITVLIDNYCSGPTIIVQGLLLKATMEVYELLQCNTYNRLYERAVQV